MKICDIDFQKTQTFAKHVVSEGKQFFSFFLRETPTKQPWLVQNSLYRPGWPQIHRKPPASASQDNTILIILILEIQIFKLKNTVDLQYPSLLETDCTLSSMNSTTHKLIHYTGTPEIRSQEQIPLIWYFLVLLQNPNTQGF